MQQQPREPTNIVLCFDGTGDWAGDDTTNVMKIYERLDRDSQITFYTGGVGTLGNPIALSPARRAFLKLLDLATATSLRDKVLEGYTFLIENYQDGDQIFLFGFSRGAFTARLLASMIHNFGLLTKEHENLAPYLWQTISEFRTFEEFKRDAALIKKDFSQKPDATIHFMGLFDTVSSVGIFERFKVYPYTDKNPSVDIIRHAVSINEQRNCFPELLIIPVGNDVKEIWFPGVHRDIGGGAKDHPGLSNQTLNWMVTEADARGLFFLDTTEAPTNDAQPHYGPFDPYVFAGLYPMKMFDYSLKRNDSANLGYAAVKGKYLTWRARRKQVRSGSAPTKVVADSKDPGFRWFWPNFTHKRTIPTNASVFADQGFVTQGDVRVPLQEVKTTEAPAYKPVTANTADTVGTILGVALAFIVLYRGLGRSIADAFPSLNVYDYLGWAWPRHPMFGDHTWLLFSSSCAFLMFAAYVIHQGLSQRLALKPSTSWINTAMPALGAVLAAYLAYIFHPWPALYIGATLGLIVAFVSQLGAPPILRADRAVAYFMVPWFLIVLGFNAASYIAAQIWPSLVITVEFLLLGHYSYLDLALPYFQTFLLCLACLAAVMTVITGFVNIIQDRRKMNTLAP